MSRSTTAEQSTQADDRWPALMNAGTAAAYTDRSERGIWKGAAEGSFPKPVKVPGSGTRWKKTDIDQFISELTTE